MLRAIRRFAWPLLVAGGIVLFWLYAASRPLLVETASVTRGEIEEYVTEEAETQLDVARLITADRSGTLRRIALDEGDPVKEGEIITSIEDQELSLTLAMLDAQISEIEGMLDGADVPLPKSSEIAAAETQRRASEAELAALREQLKGAEADRDFAAKELKRIKGLLAEGTSTEQQHDQAESAARIAEATLEALKHRIRAAELAVEAARLQEQVLQESMQDTAYLHRVYAAQKDAVRRNRELIAYEAQIRSPIDGIVLEKYVDSDRFIQSGSPLLLVGDPDSIEIRSDILSDEVARIRVGQTVRLVGRAVGNDGATGRVKQVFPSGFTKISSLGVEQQRVPVLVEFDNSGLNLGPGYELDVKVVVGREDDAVLVPAGAVFATSDGSAAFVIKEGRAQLVQLEIGLRGEDFYEATSGLSADEVVILRPPSELEEGRSVRTL